MLRVESFAREVSLTSTVASASRYLRNLIELLGAASSSDRLECVLVEAGAASSSDRLECVLVEAGLGREAQTCPLVVEGRKTA